ncbi:MAG: hypothetical protein A2516_05255 [Alphaproteobacteria bacterium RIFOXYD12_FULL_60_8]|nr:MAG: hypothetical protein A2516_05255 [Alphaproteobacteria bacterium RIFOXYD12_FULL_60_8]
MYFHYRELPPSMRVLYTGSLILLGIGYCFAMIHVFTSHAGRDGNPGLSVDDLVIAYSGSQDASRLEVALNGPMSDKLDVQEKANIVAWVHNGAKSEEWDQVQGIFADRCSMCHSEHNPHLPAMEAYEDVARLAEKDQGADIFTLIRVSHIHLFGITFIFFIMGLIFSHAFVRPVWFKEVVVAVPFVAIIADIASWYLTKLWPPFAWMVMISGALMGFSFAFQWVISFYQIWFYRMPVDAKRPRGAPKIHVD